MENDKNENIKNYDYETQVINDNNLKKQSTLFTKREWILRYASPFKALMFMAGPMIIITLVNALYGIIDKQLTLKFAVDQVISLVKNGTISGMLANGTEINEQSSLVDLTLFAKQLINVSTQYSNTIIFILQALSLLTTVGTAVKWGQAMGKRNKQEMDKILVSGLIQTMIAAAIGILVLHFLAPLIICAQANVSYANRSESIQFILANDYTQKFIYGFPLLVLSTFISALLRTEGKVWWVIGLNLVAVAINMLAGEFIMHASPANQKMAGAVYGSMIAWAFIIVTGLIVISFSKNTLLKPNFKNINLNIRDSLSIWSLGFAPFLSNLIFAVGNFILTLLITIMHPDPIVGQTAGFIVVNFHQIPGGVTSSTTYISIAIRVLSAGAPWTGILWAPITGMMQGGNANYAYNKGAGNKYKMVETFRIQIIINTIWGFLVLIILALAGGQMLKLFDGPVEQHWWLYAYFSFFFLVGWTYAAMSLFQGTGQAKYSTSLSIFRALISSITLTIIGWAIAKGAWNNDGHADWIIFLFYGMAEIPAAFFATFLLWKTAKKQISMYQIHDAKDEFNPPTLMIAALNEVTLSVEVDEKRIQRVFNHKIKKIAESNEQNKIELIEQIKNKRDLEIEKLHNKSRQKREKIQFKYRFDNISYGTDIFERQNFELSKKYNQKKFRIELNSNLEQKNDKLLKLDEWYKIKKEKLNLKQNKMRDEILNREKGFVKVTPWNLLFSKTEPQPINNAIQRDDTKNIIVR